MGRPADGDIFPFDFALGPGSISETIGSGVAADAIRLVHAILDGSSGLA